MMTKNYTRFSPIFLFIIVLIASTDVQAEVMDKEPSLQLNWAWGLCGAVACLLTALYKPILLFVVAPLPLFYFYTLIDEIRDPYVGPAIFIEAGQFYINSAYGLALLILTSMLAGLGWRYFKKQHNKVL